MLVLPDFELVRPTTLHDALQALSGAPGDAMILAGGTDLLPNLKHGLHEPRRLVSLRRVDGLRGVRETADGGLFIAAGTTLTEIARHPVVTARYPALAEAAGLVAAPQLRNMATLGGNLCLDTRCVFYNQTRFWRGALGYCLKKEGDVCHVVSAGGRCVAAFCADTPGPLIAYGAEVDLASVRGTRALAVKDFFRADGVAHLARTADEIVTGVRLPRPAPGLCAAYRKLRPRGAVDFPVLSVAVSAALDGSARVESLTVVVGALGARPRLVGRVEDLARGRVLDVEATGAIAAEAHRQCRPLPNINVDPDWRREMVPRLVREALAGLVPSR